MLKGKFLHHPLYMTTCPQPMQITPLSPLFSSNNFALSWGFNHLVLVIWHYVRLLVNHTGVNFVQGSKTKTISHNRIILAMHIKCSPQIDSMAFVEQTPTCSLPFPHKRPLLPPPIPRREDVQTCVGYGDDGHSKSSLNLLLGLSVTATKGSEMRARYS